MENRQQAAGAGVGRGDRRGDPGRGASGESGFVGREDLGRA